MHSESLLLQKRFPHVAYRALAVSALRTSDADLGTEQGFLHHSVDLHLGNMKPDYGKVLSVKGWTRCVFRSVVPYSKTKHSHWLNKVGL